MTKKGKPVRPVNAPSVLDRRFRRNFEPSKKAKMPAHPCAVVTDLKRGSLKSLDLYLKRHRGPIDREIAVELRKLISGTAARAKFRLVAIDHPDQPKPKGGRPRKANHARHERDMAIRKRYAELISEGTKRYIALEILAGDFGVSEQSIRRVLDAPDPPGPTPDDLAKARRNREVALRKLREENRSKDDPA